jgi:uncharacterized protein with HEPN domain
MNFRDETLLRKMQEEVAFISSTAAVGKQQFLEDTMLQHAVCMALITIGECANHLSQEFKEANPETPWVQIIGVRNLAAHGYWQLDMRQIWQAIALDIPELEEFLRKWQ